jgi:hypothetical protein
MTAELNPDLEMHDLLIVATARCYYTAALITKDERIQIEQ